MRSSSTVAAGHGEDRDLACSFSPYKFYLFITFAVVLGTVLALRGFRFATVVAQHLHWLT
jgi:hypothetical protein